MPSFLRALPIAALAALVSLPASAQFSLKGLLSGISGPAAVGAAADAATAPAADAPAAAAETSAAAPDAAAANAAQAAPAPAPVPTPAEIQAILQAPPAPLEAAGVLKGQATLKGKRFYIAEY
ncbi:MAG TPA: hypothetical protein VLJ58_00375, partial [Ramlibacter sp.]|nr:hypothetical protein [Ramlibacter sp.]